VGLAGHLQQTRGRDRVVLDDWLVSRPVPRRLQPWQDPPAGDTRRTLQVAAAGLRTRQQVAGSLALEEPVIVDIPGVAGQGLAAFHADPMVTRVARGAQDGVAKGMSGGLVVVGGPVGKSLAYGATGGRLMVMGDADTRACIRLSGGEVVLGGWPRGPVSGTMADANLKGYAFEYMTGGLVVVLGDPGPWMAAGMTGGVVVVLTHPAWGLDRTYLEARLAPSAQVHVGPVGTATWERTQALLHDYGRQLRDLHRHPEAERLERALAEPARWVQVVPRHQQADPAISTE
jgi:glutamate synthase (NADPH/NADH) large chain